MSKFKKRLKQLAKEYRLLEEVVEDLVSEKDTMFTDLEMISFAKHCLVKCGEKYSVEDAFNTWKGPVTIEQQWEGFSGVSFTGKVIQTAGDNSVTLTVKDEKGSNN